MTALPVLRSLLTSSVSTLVSTEEVRSAANAADAFAAADANDVATLDAVVDSAAEAFDAAIEASYAADAASAAAGSGSLASVSAEDASDAFVNVTDSRSFWLNAQSDAQKLVSSDAGAIEPLWAETSPLQEKWENTQSILQETGQSDAWAFWINWYTGLLNGSAPAADSRMMVEIALLPDALWTAEPEQKWQDDGVWEDGKPFGQMSLFGNGEFPVNQRIN